MNKNNKQIITFLAGSVFGVFVLGTILLNVVSSLKKELSIAQSEIIDLTFQRNQCRMLHRGL